MTNWKLIPMVLAYFTAASAFNCPNDAHSFYHADVSTGCQVYHRCENSQLQTFTCPAGKAFHHLTSQCEDVSVAECIETMGDHAVHDHHYHHHHHKRAAEVYHTINIEEAKNKAIEVYKAIKPILQEAVESVAPSIFTKFEIDYVPALKKVANEVLPIVQEKIWPEVRKRYQFCLHVLRTLIDRIYKSIQMSNSTHITLLSVSDIVDEVTNEVKPLIELGRYLSARVLKPNEKNRHKRETSDDGMQQLIEQVSKMTERLVSNALYGNGTDFVRYIALPVFYEMMENEQSRRDVLSLVISAKTAFTPVMWELVERQTYSNAEDTVLKIPRKIYRAAVNQFIQDSRIIVNRLVERHLESFLKRTSDHLPFLAETFQRFEAGDFPKADVLKKAVTKFFEKHGSLLQASTEAHVKFYPVKEILQDIVPIKNAIHEVFMEYFNVNEDSWLKHVFGEMTPVKKDTLLNAKPLTKLFSKKTTY